MTIDSAVIGLAAAALVALLAAALKIFREYERGVCFTLGRFTHVMGPGLVFMIPLIQTMVRVGLRVRVIEVPPQQIITRDNVSVGVSAVIYYRVMDAAKAVIQVADFNAATNQLAQTTLRSVLGQHDLDTILMQRERLNADLQKILDETTDAWGIKVANVELKQIDLDPRMVRAIARQAEAERSRRAKVIDAEGELQAATKFLEAATVLSRTPQAIHVRFLTTLQSIASDKTRTVLLPMSTELFRRFSGAPPGERDRRD